MVTTWQPSRFGQATDQNRAGPAIALGTAFLGPGQAPRDPQVIQQGVRGGNLAQADLLIVQQKTHLGRHGIPLGCEPVDQGRIVFGIAKSVTNRKTFHESLKATYPNVLSGKSTRFCARC
jgi:hypothetical protein